MDFCLSNLWETIRPIPINKLGWRSPAETLFKHSPYFWRQNRHQEIMRICLLVNQNAPKTISAQLAWTSAHLFQSTVMRLTFELLHRHFPPDLYEFVRLKVFGHIQLSIVIVNTNLSWHIYFRLFHFGASKHAIYSHSMVISQWIPGLLLPLATSRSPRLLQIRVGREKLQVNPVLKYAVALNNFLVLCFFWKPSIRLVHLYKVNKLREFTYGQFHS